MEDYFDWQPLPNTPSWLTEKELALRWTLSPRTLQRLRKSGSGPDFAYIGRSVRYPIASVKQHEVWMLTAKR